MRHGDDRSTFQRKASWRTRRPARYRQQRIRLPYDAPPLSCGHIFQGAVPKRGKGQTVSALVTIEEISLISRWRFMYSSILYEAAAKALKEQGFQKLPDLYALKNEYKQLAEQKDQMQRQYNDAKRQMQEYGIIKQNVDGILRTAPGKEQMQER